MRHHLTAAIIVALAFASTPALARSIYLNGYDVSSSFDQVLQDVDVRIDTKGNIYITAPHYQVHEESTFEPLRRVKPKSQAPMHRPPRAMKSPNEAMNPPGTPAEAKPPTPEPPLRPAEPATVTPLDEI